MNLNQLFENISADQRRVGQLPANFKAPDTSPQLSGPYPGRNATRGYLVGEAAGEDSMAQRVADMLRKTHPNPSAATEREILAATSQVLTSQGMRDVQVRFYLRDPDFQSDIIEAVQAQLQGVAEMDSQGYRGHRGDEDPGKGPEKSVKPAKSKDVAKGAEKDLTKAMDRAHKKQGVSEGSFGSGYGSVFTLYVNTGEKPTKKTKTKKFKREDDAVLWAEDYADQHEMFPNLKMEIQDEKGNVVWELEEPQGMAEAMKPSDIPPTMRQRLTMRDVEAERPAGAFRFRVTFPDGATADFMDFDAAKQRADVDNGRISRLSEDDIDDAMRDYLERGGKIEQEPSRMPRLSTRLRQHGSRHIGQGREPRAGQLSGRGANTNPRGGKPVVTAESLRDGEYHVAAVTLDDGTVRKVRITSDEGFREQIKQHFARQGRQVRDIKVDYAVQSQFDENKPGFTGAPVRPAPAPLGATRTLPPAPGRPGMTGRPDADKDQRSIEQDLARRMAAEDVLGDVKRRLGDVLRQRQQKQAERMPARQAPQDVLGDPVKQIDLGDGNTLMIHGNEDDGFRIHLGQRVMPTRFATLEQAEIATAMFEAKRDACYNKVKSRYKVWPSAYASGALVQCRKQGAANWGTGSKD
jgi:hypothetical protein